jgi:50S ribosomal protein L16 3-hydroxylase
MLVAFAVRFVTPLSTAAKNAAIQTQAVQRTMSNRVAAQSLGGIDEVVGWKPAFYDTFLSTYFQKKPLLIRNAIHGLSTLDLQMGDFVDLAGDGDVETRIFQTENANIKKYAGPFEPKDIEKHMSKPGWSLLVQEMDRHVPQVADLWSSCFPFLPTWRRDDIMFSLSAPGGSIGAHVDNYDVFLLQGR